VDKKRFKAMWNDYAAKVIPKSASGVQIQEYRRAFYADGRALLSIITVIASLSKGDTDEDVRAIHALETEFDVFRRDVVEGRT
jgi:hypothetical protein